MSQILTNELCKECNTYNLTEEYFTDGYSKNCSNCSYSHEVFANNESDLVMPDLIIGELVVLDEEKCSEEELENPIFKAVEIMNSKNVKVIEISNEISNNSTSEHIFNIKDIVPVKITPLTLFRNYIINTTLSWDFETSKKGEVLCGIRTFDVIGNSSDIDDFVSSINNSIIDFFNENGESHYTTLPGFEEAKKDYADKVKQLYSCNKEELISLYVSDAVYKFTNFNLNDEYSEDTIQEARELNI